MKTNEDQDDRDAIQEYWRLRPICIETRLFEELLEVE